MPTGAQIILSLLLFLFGHVVFIVAALCWESVDMMWVGVAITLSGMAIAPVRSRG